MRCRLLGAPWVPRGPKSVRLSGASRRARTPTPPAPPPSCRKFIDDTTSLTTY